MVSGGVDFSSNARSDILEKNSRFRTKTKCSAWCNASDSRYMDSVRDLLFQINPDYISCSYKMLFETSAIHNLRHLEDEYDSGVDGIDLPPDIQQSVPEAVHDLGLCTHEPPDRSNSCVYSSSSSPGITKKGSQEDELCSWGICERAHCAGGYQRLTSVSRSNQEFKRPNKPAHYRVASPSVKHFPSCMKFQRDKRVVSPRKTQLYTRLSRPEESPSRESSCSSIQASTPTNSRSRFKHYTRNAGYMDQYREEYTYKRLYDSPDFKVHICGLPSCPASIPTSSCVQSWFPEQSQMRIDQPQRGKETCVTSAVPIPKRTPVLKKRPPQTAKNSRPSYVLQMPRMEDNSRKSLHYRGCHRSAIQRVEVFATSLTVSSYSPSKAATAVSLSGNRIPAGALSGVHSTHLNQNPKGSSLYD